MFEYGRNVAKIIQHSFIPLYVQVYCNATTWSLQFDPSYVYVYVSRWRWWLTYMLWMLCSKTYPHCKWAPCWSAEKVVYVCFLFEINYVFPCHLIYNQLTSVQSVTIDTDRVSFVQKIQLLTIRSVQFRHMHGSGQT